MFLRQLHAIAIAAGVSTLASACTRSPSKPPDGGEAGSSLPAAATEVAPETPAAALEPRPNPDPAAHSARHDPPRDAGASTKSATDDTGAANTAAANTATAPALLRGCEPRRGESQRWFYPDELLRRAPGAVWKPGAFQGKLRALFRWTDRARGLACIRIDVLTAGPEFHRWKTESPLLRLRLLTLSSGLELVEGARFVTFDAPEPDTLYRHSLSVRCTAPDAKTCSEGTLSVAMTYPDTQFEPVVTIELER